MRILRAAALAVLIPAQPIAAQDTHRYQQDFPPEEFANRRTVLFEGMGDNSIAIIQGAPNVRGFVAFRQSNEFYYLSGIEVPHAYLFLDGRTRRTRLYLPHRDPGRERGEGKVLSAEDADLIGRLTGIDEIHPVEQLGRHLMRYLLRPPFPQLFTMFSPAEGAAQSRDELLIGTAGRVADPWDGQPTREGWFIHLLRSRYPQFELRDLGPLVDRMRIVKSPREIALIRRASELAGLGIMEAIRSTRPGLFEYQLDAAARYVFLVNGARGEGYRSITASGTNAFFGHYYRNDSELKSGDLVLMDYAPDYRYYTSDVARIWPVNGRFRQGQRDLYSFILAYRNALLDRIRPGVTSDQVLDGASKEMQSYLQQATFSTPAYRKAAEEALVFRGHLSHPVGLAVHDVSEYRSRPLEPGVVFSVDPMLWVREERLYVRMEDVVVVTEDGVENFTDFMPSKIEDIEKLIKEEGILEKTPPVPGK